MFLRNPWFYLSATLSFAITSAACDDGTPDDDGGGGFAGGSAGGSTTAEGGDAGDANGGNGGSSGSGGSAGDSSGFAGEAGTVASAGSGASEIDFPALCEQQCEAQSGLACSAGAACQVMCTASSESGCLDEFTANLVCTAQLTASEWTCPEETGSAPAIVESTDCEELNCAYVVCLDAAIVAMGALEGTRNFPHYNDRCYP